jgi:hypothetical protein
LAVHAQHGYYRVRVRIVTIIEVLFLLIVLRETGWWLITGDGKHYCADCCVWDEERDERVARP